MVGGARGVVSGRSWFGTISMRRGLLVWMLNETGVEVMHGTGIMATEVLHQHGDHV